ncbi:GNAT family N-acetyltransferase [Nostoc ellipsosporum NOK]|nr:GNAT family N-acetyltransferase [Nostoc ellipsosporum NOK]
MRATPVAPEPGSALARELTAAGLPVDDLAEPARQFFRFDDAAGLVGYGGIEGVGADRLLRSVVVVPARRKAGLGGALVAALEHAAAEEGARAFYLLTTTAEPFFRRLGYAPAERSGAPAAIADSAEFRMLCPASAAFLVKHIVV